MDEGTHLAPDEGKARQHHNSTYGMSRDIVNGREVTYLDGDYFEHEVGEDERDEEVDKNGRD
jgi:hypothetical protein